MEIIFYRPLWIRIVIEFFHKNFPGVPMRSCIALLFLLLAGPSLLAGEKPHQQEQKSAFISSGDLRTDILSVSHRSLDVLAAEGEEEIHHKSPFLAAGLSAALPGAGEFYAESYWKSALFVALEATLWTVNVVYNNKGDKQTDSYKKYADEHWSPVRYAEWINANLKYLNEYLDQSAYTIPINSNTSLSPWERIDWDALNRTERAIGDGFSHSLAPYGDQQYYEMIGKYMQFVHGWDQTDFSTTTYLDQVTTQLKWYAGERGKANDLYNTASTTATIIIINHILSAADAAWSAHLHNAIRTEVTMQKISTPLTVFFVPTLKLSICL
jgi:hypothetical protein